jgi:C4-dicarboxylate transporter DctM subunit
LPPADSETVTFAGRSNLGLAISLFILVAYSAWRGEKGLAGVPAALMAGLPIWGRNLG